MTEKDAIMISTVLGAVVLTFVLVLCRPFSWGSDTEVAVSGLPHIRAICPDRRYDIWRHSVRRCDRGRRR